MSKSTSYLLLVYVLAWTAAGRADIFRWDNHQLIPGTEGITPGPGIDLSYWNTDAHNLRFADFQGGVDLSGSDFTYSSLENARFTDAYIATAKFNGGTSYGFTREQLYSTASYKIRNLQGIGLDSNDLSGWDFSGQNLANASLASADVTNTDFTGAVVTGSIIIYTSSFTDQQLYSTQSYKERNLAGVWLEGNDLSEWDFTGQNLTNAEFGNATLVDANFSNANLTDVVFGMLPFRHSPANLTGANFADATIKGANLSTATAAGFTREQLYSTASYKLRDLQAVDLSTAFPFKSKSDLSGWDFGGQNLTDANLTGSILANANLTDAIVTDTQFGGTTLTKEQLYSTASYKARNLRGIRLTANDLSGWDFSGQNLANAPLDSANLANANLTGANLTSAILFSSTLTNANLTGADLKNANFSNASTLASAQFSTASVYNQWTTFPKEFDPIAEGLTLTISPLGDFDATDVLDVADIEMLERKIGPGIVQYWLPEAMFDVNKDNLVDASDVRVWVLDVKQTFLGDADLNGKVEFADFLSLSRHFGEKNTPHDGRFINVGWIFGDFDTSGDVQFADFLILSSNFGKTSAAAVAVPEPSTCNVALVGLCGPTLWNRRRRLTTL